MGKTKTQSGAVNTNLGYTTLPAGYVLKDGTVLATNTYVTFLLVNGIKIIQTPAALAKKEF